MKLYQILHYLLITGYLNGANLEKIYDLFAQDDFSQWTKVDGKPVGNGWIIQEGVIHRKSLNGDIITKEKFKDFELTFEWKISQAGNSGIKYRTRGRLGLEYQILDDQKHRDNKNPTHRAGSLYELVAAPDSKPLKPVGAWNKGRIVADGKQIQHWLNGEKVVEINWGTKEWKKRFQKSKYHKNQGFGSWKGPILLQDHNDPVWYRELWVKHL
tara:strand:+ start:277 stop:915 length:639 start_codon:yes stop_codon:yes gene_type:complete